MEPSESPLAVSSRRRVGDGARLYYGLVAILALAVFTAACNSDANIPPEELEAQRINRGVMCPVCPGESIDQSQHPLAIQMRGIVAERLEEGWTGDRIRGFFAESYGPSVLLEPPREGANVIVWLVPPAALTVAVLALYLILRAMVRSRQGRGKASADMLSRNEREEYFSRIEAALGSDDSRPSADDERAPEPGARGLT